MTTKISALPSTQAVGWLSNGNITSPAPATVQLGLADAASPASQTFQAQNVVAGTANTSGATLTINGSMGTGTGVGGNIVFQTAFAGGSGSSQNALAALLTLAGTAGTSSLGPLQIGGGGASVAQLTFNPNSGGSMSLGMANGGTNLNFFSGGNQVLGINGSGPILASGGSIQWSNNSGNVNTTNDLFLTRAGTNQLNVSAGSNGQQTGFFSLTESLTLSTGGTTTTSANAVPAGAILLAVSTRVTTAISGGDTYEVTVGGTQVSTSTTVSGSLNTTDPGTDNCPKYFASATNAVVTASGTPSTGAVRLTFHYILITPPTS